LPGWTVSTRSSANTARVELAGVVGGDAQDGVEVRVTGTHRFCSGKLVKRLLRLALFHQHQRFTHQDVGLGMGDARERYGKPGGVVRTTKRLNDIGT